MYGSMLLFILAAVYGAALMPLPTRKRLAYIFMALANVVALLEGGVWAYTHWAVIKDFFS